jgi:hypothetical protein
MRARTSPGTGSRALLILLRVFHRDHRMYEWTQATPLPIGPGRVSHFRASADAVIT